MPQNVTGLYLKNTKITQKYQLNFHPRASTKNLKNQKPHRRRTFLSKHRSSIVHKYSPQSQTDPHRAFTPPTISARPHLTNKSFGHPSTAFKLYRNHFQSIQLSDRDRFSAKDTYALKNGPTPTNPHPRSTRNDFSSTCTASFLRFKSIIDENILIEYFIANRYVIRWYRIVRGLYLYANLGVVGVGRRS